MQSPTDSDEAPSTTADDAARTTCPVGRCAEIIAGKWTLLVLHELLTGPRYFGELQCALDGISPRTLCDRLRSLGAEGIVTRTRIRGLPPRTVYELSERGMAFAPLITTMRAIGESWLAAPPPPFEVFDDGADAANSPGCCP